MQRICEVWAEPINPADQESHRVRYGHSRHECIRTREFAQEHEGFHECECGLHWQKQPSDND